MNDKNYDDIINLPCPTSKRHPRMAMIDRVAQFAPFAALTGYDDAITETGRLTGTKLDLSEETKEGIDLKINFLIDNIEENPEITVTYFVPDKRKSGGEYLTVTGKLKKIDGYEQTLLMEGIGTGLGNFSKSLVIIIPVGLILWLIIKAVYSRSNTNHNHDTLPLKLYN